MEVDGVKDPELKLPKKKDLKLGLDRSAKDSIDEFSDGPVEPTEKTEAAGNFDSRGLSLGSGASLIPVPEAPEQNDQIKPDDVQPDGKADVGAGDPKLEAPAVEPMIGLLPNDEAIDSQDEMLEPQFDEQEPSLDLQPLLASFAAVRDRLDEFDAALSQSVARLQIPQLAGTELPDEVKRAIIQTAENTAQLAERVRAGGFVFA